MKGFEKPILFNTEMVKAIVDGKKIVTRRVIKNKYPNADIELFENKYGKRLVYKQNLLLMRMEVGGFILQHMKK